MMQSRIMSTAIRPSMTWHRRDTDREAGAGKNRRHPAPLSRSCFYPGTSRVFLTVSLCVSVLALSQATGILADTGMMIYDDGHHRKNVKIGDHAVRARQSIDAIRVTCHSSEPPPLVLNRHCAVCDFQPRCRGLAVGRDDLSLLSAMTGKERAKCNAKGIFTVAQLSYGYRPRRRKRSRPDAESSKASGKPTTPITRNDHKLKALAIKKNQIHVVGAPSLKFDGTPTFLDVEGMPDRDFYYLIGLRFESGGQPVERSFWADGLDRERAIWESCLRELKAIGNAQIVSYGAYETRFLRQMKARYILKPDDMEFVDQLIGKSIKPKSRIGCHGVASLTGIFDGRIREHLCADANGPAAAKNHHREYFFQNATTCSI
jgi:predicted RecB family nuclease